MNAAMKIKNEKKNYERIQNEISKSGYSFDIYKYNINDLTSQKTVTDFLKSYEIIHKDGRNVIELDRLISDKNFLLKDTSTTLEDLIAEMWETVASYADSELECIREED